MLFLLTGQSGSEQVEPVFNTTNNGSLFENPWFVITLCIAVLVLLYYFFKKFTSLKLENFESYTSHQEQIVKIRTLSILSFLLFPLTEYYESIYLKLYPTDWTPVFVILLISLFSLLVSFKKNVSFAFLNFLPQLSYYTVYAVMLYKALKAGMLPIMAVETACLILFSKLIFTKLKNLLLFLVFVLIVNVILVQVFTVVENQLDIYISASLQASIVSISLFLIEGSSNRKVAFGNKILESSNLFVLVADSNANFVYVNQSLESVTGLKQTDILKEGWWTYLGYNEETTLGLKKLITDSISKNQFSTYESSIIDKDGNTIYVSWDNSIIEEKYLLAVGKNITLAKLMQIEEDKRKEKINRYSKALNSLTQFQYSDGNKIDDTLKLITKVLAENLEIGRAGIWNYSDDKITCTNIYTADFGEYSSGTVLSKIDFPTYFNAISKAQIIDAPDALNHPETIEFAESYFAVNNIKSLLDIPIFINGELKGVICCEAVDKIKNWDAEDISFTKTLADFVALSIEADKRKELEREYQFILNNVGDIIYTTDSLGNFDFINSTAKGLLGYNVDDLKGKHFTSIIHHEYKAKTTLFYLKQFKQRKESTYLEFKIINAEGKDYWVGQTVKLVEDPTDSLKIKGFQAVVRNINKQKEIELALTESENNFRQINESISDVFFLYNFTKEKYDYISPNCEKILGANQNFFYTGGSYNKHFIYELDRERLVELVKTGNNKKEYVVEYRVLINGQIRWLEERAFPVKDEKGVVIKSCGVCSDITESKSQKEQLKQLSLVAQTVSNGVVITNPQGLIEWCNESYVKMMGYELEEMVGKRPIELFSGSETKSEAIETIKETKLEGNSIELLQYTKSGMPIWLMITNTPTYDSEGSIEKFVEIITDITERKKLEGNYRYIIDNAGDIIYTTNALGIVEFLNESVTKILGYQAEELIGKHFTHIIHPEDKRLVNLFYLKQYKLLKEDSYFEFRVLNKEGGTNWVGQNVKLTFDTSKSQNIKGFQSILRDITKQKETEIALIESENNFRQINETIHDVFYLYNVQENKYDYVSPNSINILGVDNIYFYYVNNYMNDYIVPKDREMVNQAYEKIKNGESFEIEYRITIDQEITWIKEKAAVIKDSNGLVIKTSGTCSDVTQRKMQEKRLLKINQELSLYSEDLEINNLLKEQLIYTNSFEEIAKVSLTTLKVKITNIKRGALLLVNENSNLFDTYSFENDEIKRDLIYFAETKSYPILLKGKRFIEHNLDLSTNLSKSDIQARKDNILSYIVLPISYSNILIGALMLSFETPFSVSKRDIDMLESFTSVLSVVVNKLGLQKELSEKSKNILASLNYARGIQQSILPNINLHKESIANFMCFYLPKDVVSGDFYVIESFDEYTLVALGDCTGHGVPGAFLTLLGSNFLQRIAIENKVNSPKQILESLDYQLFTMLNKNREETIRDGMELGLCLYNNKTKKLTFAGAGLFLVYYKNNEQIIIQGSKRSVGDENHTKVDFEETTIDITGSEKFFMFSDGYRDQLGGIDKRKRFSRARFLDLLNKIKNLPPFQQEFVLKLEHDKHRGKYEQTDDISVIGFELK